jgi:hypothetical protein
MNKPSKSDRQIKLKRGGLKMGEGREGREKGEGRGERRGERRAEWREERREEG